MAPPRGFFMSGSRKRQMTGAARWVRLGAILSFAERPMSRFVPLALLITLTACIQTQAQENGGFDGTYRLASIDGAAISGTADLTIAGKSLRGQGPCNSYWTTNTADWPEIALAPTATTRRQCFAEGGEAAFLTALEQVTRAEPVKGGLELSGPSHRIRFAVGD